MNSADLVRRLHQHRAWVNGKLLAAARALSDDKLRKQMPIGQGSIWKSLLHLYAAEFVWIETLSGNEAPRVPGDLPGKIPGNQEAEGAIRTLEELAGKWQALEARWRAYLKKLSEGDLSELVYKVTTQGKRMATRRGDILLHISTHAQYTTAQVINMLRQVGVQPLPDPMLITLAREEAAAGG